MHVILCAHSAKITCSKNKASKLGLLIHWYHYNSRQQNIFSYLENVVLNVQLRFLTNTQQKCHIFLNFLSISVFSYRVRHTLRKKSSYSELFCSAFFPDFPAFGLNTLYLSVFSPNAGKCGKNEEQNNSEYGLFLRRDKD